ncbi:neuron navigator 1-like isoform X2 [Melanotaenia boesemani]|uniref:neuron navigator 1-like isoform X2 n=1 Tax=Melanotaenia boesemani TaxID=1250792 RepID=UPI001C04FB3F|nr:neuron navigator 1-like isoform X2 [Melanotaenia boesemani]
MSGGVNLKSAPRGTSSSGIPLPRNLLPTSPKTGRPRQASDLHKPLTLTPKPTPTHTPSHSPVLCPRNSSIPGPSSKGLVRDTSLKGQFFQRTGALPVPQVSRSAYSSPMTQRRLPPPHSKDTLDLRKATAAYIPSQFPHNGNYNRSTFTNKNQAWGASNLHPPPHFRRGGNSNTVAQEANDSIPTRAGRPPENHLPQSPTVNNSNIYPTVLQSSYENAIRTHNDSASQSDEDMGTPEDSSPASSPDPPPLPFIAFTTPVIASIKTQDQNLHKEGADMCIPRVNMATVAPFSYRLQIQEGDFSVDELSDCSSGSIEVCCDDLTPGGMVEANVASISLTAKPRVLDLRSAVVSCQDTSAQAMASRKPQAKPSGLPQGPPRPPGSELKVYRPTSGSIPIPIPNPSRLRKQRSLNNLCVLTDAEKKMHLYQSPQWNDDTSRPGTGSNKAGQTKTGPAAGGRPPLSRTLSKSEQSLFQGKPKSFCSPAVSSVGKPSRIPAPGKPRGPYAEVKPISKATEGSQNTDMDPAEHLSKANSNGAGNTGTNGKKPGEKGKSGPQSTEEKKEKKGTEGEDDKGFLKVDPELVVTVLGDLEQLLFSQMLDPESQRKRTVQNVLDLRQNLEETMTSLRGVQLSHSCVEGTMCYDSDEAAAFSISSLSNRSSPLSWRQGQASPRLQAGDAPSTGNTSSDVPLRINHMPRIHLIEDLVESDTSLLKGDYLSDSDLGGKSPNDDDEDDDDDDDIDDLGNGWDESSSISSGLSDGSDNLSSEDFNTSPTLNSLPTTPIGSRRNSTIVMRTDAEKRSLVESGLSWDSDDNKPGRKSQGRSGYDTGSLKSESANKWKKTRLQGDGLEAGKRELKKPQSLGQGNVLKKGRNPPVGVTSPITHTSQSGLKVAGSVKSDGKPMDKSRLAMKTSGLQRSSSDAGKDHRNGTGAGEQRKPPSGLVRPSTGGNFGFKKTTTASSNGTNNATTPSVTGTSVNSTASGSAAAGKIPKMSGIPVKPGAGGGGRKTSLDVSSSDQSGFLSPNARTSLQYRSLPRPAKTNTLTLTRPSSARPISTTMDTGSGLMKPSTTAPQGSKLKEPASGIISGTGLSRAGGRGIPSPSPVNQTDREKEKERAKAKIVVSDSECGGGSLKGSPAQTPSDNGGKPHGLRPPSSGKSMDLPSPSTHRLSGMRSLTKPPSMVQLDKLNSNSLEIEVQDALPPKIPPYSKLQDLCGSGGSSNSTCLTPSPAPLLNVNSSACFSSSGIGLGPRQVTSLGVVGSEGSTSPLLYPRVSGLHRSMESLPLQMSLAPEPQEREKDRGRETLTRDYTTLESRDKERQKDRGPPSNWSSGNKVSLPLTDSSQRDRNTLPKKGLSFNGASQVEEEGKEKGERRHSHTALSMTDSLTLPLLSSPTSLPRTCKTTMVSSPVGGPPRMTRSNSIPTHDASMELYGASPLGSTLSLADRPRSMGMVRSGSFRDREPNDEVHGSVLSLASNASSSYSSVSPVSMQTQQIRKLRRELESSQEKVSCLTTQLTANANLVAAFEQSLAMMTSRLQSLSISHEQKDSELVELRDTIDALKARNEEAQAVIHGALNNPDNMKDLRIQRQNSCESISSLNSLTSMSSVGSLKDQDAKKKKKKSWLRSSFNKAFSIKKGSKTYSDIEEIVTPDSSAPNSPKMAHEGGEAGENQPLASSTSSVIMETAEEGDNGDTAVSELRSELWEKERKLTDIRLEALNSAHQLEQLREAMNNMQSTVENLKAENDHLKTGSLLHLPGSGPTSSTSQPSGLASLLGPSVRQPMSMSFTKSFSLSLNDCKDSEVCPDDFQSVSSQREELCAKVLVRTGDHKEEIKQQQEFYLGLVPVSVRTDWTLLDSLIAKSFKDYLSQVDPTASLGLSCDSLHMYQLSQGGERVIGEDSPQVSPYRCLGSGPARIFVTLKGLREKCVDSLVFETLIPKPMMLHYISLLMKHRRLILSGPSGTGKTYLAQHLAHYLLQRSQIDSSEGNHEPCVLGRSAAVTFNMHRQSQKDLQLYLANLANQIDRENVGELPLVVIIDDISDSAAITELVNGALTCKYHKCPYIIGTSNQPVKMTSNHGLHLSFRMVMFSNNVEPANGFLLRYLHRKAMEAYQAEEQDSTRHQALLRILDWIPQLWYHLHTFLEKHSTSDFLIGPCFFLSCPVSVAEFRQWFIDLWNHSIIPYLQEGSKDGIKVHGHKAVWEDPVEWVRGTLPWPNAQQDQSRLFHLPPPSIGSSIEEKKPPKDTPPPSTLESDPLMAMLLKLQESANYIESPEREGCLDPTLQATL